MTAGPQFVYVAAYVVFVPVVVAATHLVAASSVPLRFLLVPPLAVLAERGAAAPRAPTVRLPSMVVAPSVGAAGHGGLGSHGTHGGPPFSS